MPLPWQHTFCHCRNVSCTFTPKADICAEFHENRSKTEEVVRDARFSPFFAHNIWLPWQHTFCHCQKLCLGHLHPKANICAEFHENRSKTEEVVRDARFSPIFLPIIYGYHGNTLSATVKTVSCTSTPQGKHLCRIHENRSKTEEVVRDARFSPIFCP